MIIKVHVTQACRTHPNCVIHYRRDPARNRLRGQATHVRSWNLYDGRLEGGFGVFEFSGWKPTAGPDVMKLLNVAVRDPFRARWVEEPGRGRG